MAAHHHINPQQLQLFLDPQEHIARIKHSTDLLSYGFGATMEDLWTEKTEEAMASPEGDYDDDEFYPGPAPQGAGLYDDLRSGGHVRRPVEVMMHDEPDEDRQYEGHHRIAAAAQVQREDKEQQRRRGETPHQTQFVPVKYHDYRTR